MRAASYLKSIEGAIDMTLDPIRAGREIRSAGKKRGNWCALLLFAVLLAGSYMIYLKEVAYEFVDFYVHTHIAGDFDFSDLHSITSRLAYPMWHLLVSAIYQLGVPLEHAAVGVSAVCKAFTYLLVYALVISMSGDCVKRWISAVLSFFVVIVTAIWIPSLNLFIYQGVGSPNVWHNPTQQIVTLAMMLVMPWLAHCWYEFEAMLSQGRKNVTLPWWKVLVLAVLCMGSLACKPTFMQALLPAAFVMFLVELLRHKTEWRYFGQIVLAFLPSAGYFLLQYLYYTGVVVEFTSGVEFGVSVETAVLAVRNSLMMGACPLMALLACWRKGLFRDRLIVLSLLMVLFSVLEAMAFRETGLRVGHGNFTWAANSSAFFLWAVMVGVFLREFHQHWVNGTLNAWRKAGGALTIALLGWHLYSAVAYLRFLSLTENAF